MTSLRVIMRTIEDVLNRLRAEFLEMPGLRLKPNKCNVCAASSGRFARWCSTCSWTKSFCASSWTDTTHASRPVIIRIPRRQTLEPTSVPRRLRDAAGKGRLVFHGECRMLWIGTAVTLVAAIVALMVVILANRPVDVHELGSVSDHWIAQHRSQ